MHLIDAKKTHREKATWKLHKNATSCYEQSLEASPPPQDNSGEATNLPAQKPTSKTNKICSALLEK